MKLLVFALVGLATAGAAGSGDKVPAPEEAMASLSLGAPLPPSLRCPKAVPTDTGVVHRFRVGGAGPGGHDAYLLVSTECPKAQCASQAELTISEVAIRATPYPGPTCTLGSPPVLASGKGLRLGDPIARVKSLYGKPNRVASKQTSFEYAGRSESSGINGPREGVNMGFEVGFDGGRAVEMSLFVVKDPD
jgi:hypothetical protein